MPTFSALHDANVLHSIPVTDVLLQLATTGLYRPRWSNAIHEEWVRSVERERPDLDHKTILKRRDRMDEAFPFAKIDGFAELIAGLELPDPDDRHVLAAAIVGRVDVIVTFNVRDFPAIALSQFGLDVQNPDEFLNHQRTLDEPLFWRCIKEVRGRLKNPKYAAEGYLEHLSKCGLPAIAAELLRVKELI